MQAVLMNEKLYKMCVKKGFRPEHVAEVGVYLPETSNILGFINDGVKTSLFEPDPVCIAKINEYFSGKENVKLYPYAITDHEGKVSLYQRGASSFLENVETSPATIIDKYTPDDGDKLEVEAKKFNEFDDGSIDLLSVDTEGGEWFVIKNMISEPTVISIETNARDYVNPHLQEITDWLSDRDYCIWFKDQSDTIFIKKGTFELSFFERFGARRHAAKLFSGRLAP
jgi:FkbM family methyltransferase